MCDLHHATDPTGIRIDLLAMDSHQRKCTPRATQKIFDACNADFWLSQPGNFALFQNRLYEFCVRMRLHIPDVADAKTFKTVKPHAIANKREEEELWTNIEYIASNLPVLESATESHQLAATHCVYELS